MGPTAHAIASESSPLALTVGTSTQIAAILYDSLRVALEPSNPSSKSRSHAGPILSGPRRSKRRTIVRMVHGGSIFFAECLRFFAEHERD